MLVAFSRHKRSCLWWRLGQDILQANRLFAIIILIKILMIDIPGKRQGIVIIIVIMMMIQAMLMMLMIMMSIQAGIQLTVLGISLAVSIIGGLVTGIIINIPFITR